MDQAQASAIFDIALFFINQIRIYLPQVLIILIGKPGRHFFKYSFRPGNNRPYPGTYRIKISLFIIRQVMQAGEQPGTGDYYLLYRCNILILNIMQKTLALQTAIKSAPEILRIKQGVRNIDVIIRKPGFPQVFKSRIDVRPVFSAMSRTDDRDLILRPVQLRKIGIKADNYMIGSLPNHLLIRLYLNPFDIDKGRIMRQDFFPE